MGVLEDVDLASIEHLDFEAPCSLQVRVVLFGRVMPARSKQCDQPAVELITCRSCGRAGTVRGPHGRWLRLTGHVSCQCDCSGPGVVVFRFTPLGGA